MQYEPVPSVDREEVFRPVDGSRCQKLIEFSYVFLLQLQKRFLDWLEFRSVNGDSRSVSNGGNVSLMNFLRPYGRAFQDIRRPFHIRLFGRSENENVRFLLQNVRQHESVDYAVVFRFQCGIERKIVFRIGNYDIGYRARISLFYGSVGNFYVEVGKRSGKA